MAKRGSGGVRRDRFINRYRGRLALGADTSVVAVESFNTGMNVGRENPTKWVITHAFIQPALSDDGHGNLAASSGMAFQLAIGNQTAQLEPDDMQVIATGHISAEYAAAGPGGHFFWPLYLPMPAPLPVFAQALTVSFRTGANFAPLVSDEMYYEIGYVISPIAQDEIVEYLSAFGQV